MKPSPTYKTLTAALLLVAGCTAKEAVSIKDELALLESKGPSTSHAQVQSLNPKAFTLADIKTIEKEIDLTEEQKTALLDVAE